MNTNFNEDLFLTLDGCSLLQYVENIYPKQYNFLEINGFVKRFLYQFLADYFDSREDVLLIEKHSKALMKILYNNMIERVDYSFKNDFHFFENSKYVGVLKGVNFKDVRFLN